MWELPPWNLTDMAGLSLPILFSGNGNGNIMKIDLIIKNFWFRYALKKAGKLIVIAVVVSLAAFTLLQFSPIDSVRSYIGADLLKISEAQKKKIEEKWGLNKPPVERLGKWLSQVLHGNMGNSLLFNDSVWSVIKKRFITSFAVMVFAWILSGLIGLVLGIISGVWNNSILAKIIDLYAYILASAPVFWIGIILLVIFSVSLQWTPVGGAHSPGLFDREVSLGDKLYHMILPAVTLSIVGIAGIILHTKEKVIEIMQSDFVLYGIAQGENTWAIVRHYVLRNALLPAITLQFATLNEIFGGSVLIEQVFSYPGLGKAAVDAGTGGDIPLLLGITVFSAIFVFTGNTIADVMYKLVDPRITYGKEEADYDA
jgi:peptide/nickel transport system permease protein